MYIILVVKIIIVLLKTIALARWSFLLKESNLFVCFVLVRLVQSVTAFTCIVPTT